MMDASTGAMGVVAAAPGVANPSDVAYSLLSDSMSGLEFGSLIRPCVLCGDGARRYAVERDILKSVSITEKTRLKGESYLRQVQKTQDEVVDTVGCIVVANHMMVAAGRSGGNWLSYPGRTGLCGVPGAGVWCDGDVGCVLSGVGETCVRRLFAKQVCDIMQSGIRCEKRIEMAIKEELVHDMEKMRISLQPSFGVVAVKMNKTEEVSVIVSSLADMFGYGYVSIREDEIDKEDVVKERSSVVIEKESGGVTNKFHASMCFVYSWLHSSFSSLFSGAGLCSALSSSHSSGVVSRLS